jgi:hypothetical protein
LIAALDIDLRDARMQRLGIVGERLRLAMCPHCSPQMPTHGLYFDCDPHGHCGWSATNSQKRPPDIDMYADGEVLHLPERQLVLGSERHTPLEAYATYWSPGISQIGGFPEWVQDAEYPPCPACRQTMIFVAQIEPLDIVWEEGVIYFFACFTCGKSTVGFQQT